MLMGVVPTLLCNQSKVVIRAGGSVLVAMLFFDREGFLIPVLCLLPLPLLLCNDTELVIRGGGSVLVAMLFFDREGFLIPALCLLPLPLFLLYSATIITPSSSLVIRLGLIIAETGLFRCRVKIAPAESMEKQAIG